MSNSTNNRYNLQCTSIVAAFGAVSEEGAGACSIGPLLGVGKLENAAVLRGIDTDTALVDFSAAFRVQSHRKSLRISSG